MLGAMRSNKLFALARSVRLKGLLYALYRYFPRRRRLGHTPALWRWQLLIHTLANTGNLLAALCHAVQKRPGPSVSYIQDFRELPAHCVHV